MVFSPADGILRRLFCGSSGVGSKTRQQHREGLFPLSIQECRLQKTLGRRYQHLPFAPLEGSLPFVQESCEAHVAVDIRDIRYDDPLLDDEVI